MTDLISQHLDLWTSAIASKSSAGRGNTTPSPTHPIGHKGESRGEGNPTNTRNAKYTAYGIKKLRELILELAVRGKLVPQDLNDEPANDLLNQINDLKNKLVLAGEIKTQKPLDEISFDEMTFDLPHGWIWCRLGEICEFVNGYAFKSSDFSDQGIGIVKIGDIQNGEITTESMSRVNKSVVDGLGDAFVVKNGEMVIAMSGATTGKLGFNYTDEAFYLNQRVGKISPFICYSRFLYYPLTTKIQENLAKSMGSAIPNLSTAQIKDIVLALPPLAEQHRIVAKVDELMALCDQLERQQTDNIAAHQTLVQTLLDTLTQAADAAEFEQAWSRIADHFDTLFTTEASIDQLKQTLLQLAVMGKLVPQDSNDEPVTQLIRRIKDDEADRVKRKEIQRSKNIETESVPSIRIPDSWMFKLLNDLSFVTKLAGFEYTNHINLQDHGDVPVVRAQNVRPFNLDKRNLKYIDLDTSSNLPRSALDKAALLITFIGAGIGDVCVFNEKNRWHLAPNVAKAEPFADLSPDFLNVFLNSPEGRKEIFKSIKSTAQPNLSMATIREIWLPVPPVAEQHRIVAKVDELMALCDALKARIAAAQTTQLQLADAIVEQAVA
ncbi:restriction endonuclease subunit S [Methylomonas koyamae]|uniref:restriction endonuclease subunit S n=1 Tax=Methylomonas koyamae TaxID=702114 RepID=UPI001126336B|nr:restriction endonuclease subunit S [Methylomonas koyamae]TPQ26556.1 type I restriction endonuclease subunit S [Methylomonas koyamae]